MSMQDPIADMLTRIRNGQMAKHETVNVSSSTLKLNIVKVLKEEGFITDFAVSDETVKKSIKIALKYFQGVPVINKIKRISRPGLRIYKSHKDIAPVSGFGVAVMSTPKGVMSDKQAKLLGIGGEVLCEVA